MQSDWQSVGNGAVSTFARAFAPKLCETAVSRVRITWTFLQDLSRAVSRFSRCPVAGIHRRYFSDPTGSNTITIRDRIGKNMPSCRKSPSVLFRANWVKYDYDPIPATGHLEKQETALDRSWRKVHVILGRETEVSHIFGAKPRASVPIAPFPTDCKSDCTRSGPRTEHGTA